MSSAACFFFFKQKTADEMRISDWSSDVCSSDLPIAVACAGFVPFAMMAADDGSFGYEMEIIVPADSPIQSPEDLRGKTLAFTAPTSNSGFKAPSAILRADFGLAADKDYKTAFSGKHANSVIGVANQDYDAAAVANEGRFRD